MTPQPQRHLLLPPAPPPTMTLAVSRFPYGDACCLLRQPFCCEFFAPLFSPNIYISPHSRQTERMRFFFRSYYTQVNLQKNAAQFWICGNFAICFYPPVLRIYINVRICQFSTDTTNTDFVGGAACERSRNHIFASYFHCFAWAVCIINIYH